MLMRLCFALSIFGVVYILKLLRSVNLKKEHTKLLLPLQIVCTQTFKLCKRMAKFVFKIYHSLGEFSRR